MRGKPIQIGDTVIFKLYNTPDKCFYGPSQKGKVVEILNVGDEKKYRVFVPEHQYIIRLHRKEIKKVL
jgi:hypothetical protein